MRANRSRKELAVVSTLAIATVLVTGAIAAHAQSFQASGTVVAGNASIFATGSSTDITVRSPNAVINWVPTDTGTTAAPINFQTAGTTATFKNDASFTSDFAVLNRILPSTATRAVQFNGTVVSQLLDSAGAATRGGTVFFYSPGGILVGSTGVFDVGSLALTTSDLAYDAGTGAFGTAGTYDFLAANAGSSVQIANGASITAGPNGAYVALVAPSIVQDGAISVDGSAALVAADAATITFKPSGLFDIAVTSGTSASGTVLSNSGSVGGPAGSSSLFNHRIFMVAVPKNDAITMAIASGSSLGFDIAGAADVTGNAIILSAGQDVLSGLPTFAPSIGGGTGQADAAIGAITATSALTAAGTGSVNVRVLSGETSSYAADLALLGQYNPLSSVNQATQIEVLGGSLDVAGQVYLNTTQVAPVATAGSGGSIINVNTGTFHAAQNVFVHADGNGIFSGQSGTGGLAGLVVNAGTVTVDGALSVTANGVGQYSVDPGVADGNGTGGFAQIFYGGGSSITVGNSLVLSANGRTTALTGVQAPGGAAQGGQVRIQSNNGGGTLDVGGDAVLDATASTFNGGSALGGSAFVALNSTTAQSVTFHGNLDLAAGGYGGTSSTAAGGAGTGGNAYISATGAAHTLAIQGATTVLADGVGGGSDSIAAGGQGNAGSASITSDGTTMNFTGSVAVTAFGSGGANTGNGASGSGNGGAAVVTATNGGALSFASTLDVLAGAAGGGSAASGTGGAAQGGSASIQANGGTIALQQFVNVNAQAIAGLGAVAGGAAVGGFSTISTTNGGVLQADGIVQVYSDAFGGPGATSADGKGGTSTITVNGGAAAFGPSSTVLVYANGNGGSGRGASGGSGNGLGGAANINVANGTLTFGGDLQVLANAYGGVGSNGSVAGSAQGGTINLAALDSASGPSTLTLNTATLSVDAFGGLGGTGTDVGQSGGNGGFGQGGSVSVTAAVSNGTLSASSLTVHAVGLGGEGGAGGFDPNGLSGAGGNGGAAIGGTIVIDTPATIGGSPSGQLTIGAANFTVSAYGGDGGLAGPTAPSNPNASGGVGGSALAGSISILSDQGGSNVSITGGLTAYAQGVGGDGGGCFSCTLDGGSGTGGSIFVGSLGNTTGNILTLGGTTLIDTSGFGGTSMTTDGAVGTGGSASVIASAGVDITASSLIALALAVGGEQVATETAGLSGGAALGGFATVESRTGGSIVLQSTSQLRTTAFGGSGLGLGSSSGSGTGGRSAFASVGGTLVASGFLTVEADGIGGSGDINGRGGDGTGGLAIVSAGRVATLGNNGTVSLGGITVISARGQGSTGGTGGTGLGGEAQVVAHGGTVTATADIVMNVDGSGGLSTSGVTGGSGIGGLVLVNAIGDIGGGSQLTLAGLNAHATGMGAAGASALGDGITGGAGGTGAGGTVAVVAEAGNGSVSTSGLTLTANGVGGFGGDGTGGDVNDGSNGGVGGHGIGGNILIGLRSGADTGTINTGTANYGAIVGTANGLGGLGGAGGAGISTTGAGGNGGAADGGTTEFIVRGGAVTTAGVTLYSNGIGGAGGTGSTQGNGGDATIHANSTIEAALAITNRFQQPTQLGTLNTAGLAMFSQAIGGTGAAVGNAMLTGAPLGVFIRNSTVTGGSITVQTTAPTVATNVPVAPLLVTNSTVNLSGSLTLTTPSDVTLTLDGSNVTVGTATIDARNWILGTPPTQTPGTLRMVNGFFFGTDLDLVAYANLDAPYEINFGLPGNLRFDNITATGLSANVGGSISIGNYSTGYLSLLAGGPITTGAISSNGYVELFSGGAVNTGALSATSFIDVEAATSVNTGAVTGGEQVDLTAGGTITTTGAIVGGDTVTLQAGGDITTGAISSGIVNPSSAVGASYDIGIASGGSVVTGNLQSLNGIAVIAQQSATLGTLAAVDVGVLTGGNIATQSITASGRVLLADASMAQLGGTFDSGFDREAVFAATPVRTAGSISIAGPVQAGRFDAATQQSFTATTISSQGRLTIDAGGPVVTAALNAAGQVRVRSGGPLQTGDILAAGTIDILGTGAITTGILSGATGVLLSGGASVATGAVSSSSGGVALIAGSGGTGSLSTGNISASQQVTARAAGTLTAGTVFSQDRIIAVSTGDAQFAALQTGNGRGTVEVAAGSGSISVGSVRAARDVALIAGANLTTGQVLGRDLLLLAGGNVATGNILAGLVADPATSQITNATGRAMIAGRAMASAGGSFGSYDYNAVFNAVPVRAGGSVTVNGVVLAGRLVSYSSGAMSAQRINAFGSIDVESGGLVTVAQQWSAPSISILSSDIDIRPLSSNGSTQAVAGLSAPTTGDITLISTNPGQALIGDGLSGNGYALSGAELALIRAGSLTIAAQDNAAQPIDMLIGKLALTGPDAGGQISDPAGTVTFATGNISTRTPGGGIRVIGDVAATGFRTTNTLEFLTGRFELAADTGSIAVTGTNNALSGIVGITANNVHVASGTILDKLAADPFYTGVIADLNAPAAIQRPDGVLRAFGLDIVTGSTFYVQNTGTMLDPAGFVTTFDATDVTPPDGVTTPGSIALVINGKFQTDTGLVGGRDAFDIVVKGADQLSNLTSTSQINGCLLNVMVCGQSMDPAPNISSQITILTNNSIGNTPAFAPEPPANAGEPGPSDGGSDQPAEAESSDAASAPIAPPAPVIDSRPLNPPNQIETPISGGGNPALIGSIVNENTAQGDDQ